MATKFDQTDPMYEKIMAAHDAAVSAGLTEYKDPKTGFSVMTEPFLKAKGFCCKNNCKLALSVRPGGAQRNGPRIQGSKRYGRRDLRQ